MDLVRQIMLKIEDLPPGQPVHFRMGEVEDPVLLAHLQLMMDARLVNGKVTEPHGSRGAVIIITDLTWEGHEWIETVRREELWEQVKGALLEKECAFSFELSRAVALQIQRVRLGLPA